MAGEQLGYRIGPASAESARVWLTVARANLETMVAAGPKAPFRIPPEIVGRFRVILDEWQDEAASEPFVYEGEEDRERARMLLTYWLNIISLTEAQRTALGVAEWPPESVPFEDAVGRSILGSLRGDAQLRRLNRALRGSRRR